MTRDKALQDLVLSRNQNNEGTNLNHRYWFKAGYRAALNEQAKRASSRTAHEEPFPSGCTPCADCGIDYAAYCGAWLVADAIWQRVVGTDPTVVLCPSCFAVRAAREVEELPGDRSCLVRIAAGKQTREQLEYFAGEIQAEIDCYAQHVGAAVACNFDLMAVEVIFTPDAILGAELPGDGQRSFSSDQVVRILAAALADYAPEALNALPDGALHDRVCRAVRDTEREHAQGERDQAHLQRDLAMRSSQKLEQHAKVLAKALI